MNLARNPNLNYKEVLAGLSKIPALTELDLSENELTEMPEELGGLTNIEEINLSMNKLEKLPASIANLKQLKKLTIFNNKISQEEQAKIKALLPNCSILF